MSKEKFGPYITALRERLGITKAELARRTGMTRSYIGFIEDDAVSPGGEPPNVSVGNLLILARELGVSEQEMLDRGYKSPHGFRLVPTSSAGAATQLIRESLEKYNVEGNLDPADLDDLSSEVEDFACIRVKHRVRQSQTQASGKQMQKQGIA